MKKTILFAFAFLVFVSSPAYAQDSITLTRMNAYATLCNAQQPCSRELDESIITIELVDHYDGTQSGSFEDYSHLPTAELFSYQINVVESTNPAKPDLTITVTCQLENKTGDLVFECPKNVRKAKSRASVKKFDYVHEVLVSNHKYNIQLSYTSAE